MSLKASTSADISSVLKSSKIALEKQAADKFGAAVETFTKSAASTLGIPSPETTVNRNDGNFYSSSYAAALAGGTSYRPKHKFLFTVEFIFTQEAKRLFPQLNTKGANDFTFMVTKVDKPKITFDWEDDINMYNFRTKALKKIHHDEIGLSFLDDTGNRVFNLFRMLVMLYQPITRRQLNRDGTTDAPKTELYDGNGMAFTSDLSAADQKDSSHRAVINSSVGNAIEAIRVKQVFIDPSAPLSNAVKEIAYDFLNARIVSFDFDELASEGSDLSTMSMKFDYDWLEMVEVGALAKTDGPIYDIKTPGVLGAPVNYTPAGNPVSTGGNPFLGILTNQAGRLAQKLTSSAINSVVKVLPGNNVLNGALGSYLSTSLGSLAKSATTFGLGGGFNAPAPKSLITDSALGGAGVSADAFVPSGDGSNDQNVNLDM